MKSIATWFLATGGFFALAGMVWGIQMAATHDHTLAPAHGHLNLIGFVAMSVFGTYYALTPRAAQTRLAAIHYWLVTSTVVTLTPGIVFAISGRSEILVQISSILAVLSMALFVFTVLRHGVGKSTVQESRPLYPQTQPAK
ncbi:MAG: hypothetical protein ACSHW1_10165 [Yoonia sp.]|uniref:hypothetical protein n=1 Tax=Yoonia sp. TaxID=2212373 RepID=UPI003EF696BD